MKTILTVLIVLLIAGGSYYSWDHSKAVCDLREGKWASVQSVCVTRDCYSYNNCGDWAFPHVWCKNLKIGDDISEVYFQLGQPHIIEKNTYYWPVGKAESRKITATFENNKLKTLNCDAT